MSHVTKSDGWDVYSVRANHEWATIAVKGWRGSGVDGRPTNIGEIMIHSSYGSWAYQWGYLGEPFKQWLATADDRSYIAKKFMGSEAYQFDGEKTVRELRADLLQHRRQGDLTRADARSIWDFIDAHESELESSEHEFVERIQDCTRWADWEDHENEPGPGAHYFLLEPWDRIAKSLDTQFTGFWNEIMPVFQQALRYELQAAKEAA